MKPILHGLDQLKISGVERVPTEKVNVKSLIDTLEANYDKKVPEDWMNEYYQIAEIYKVLFSKGFLPDEMMNRYETQILQYAYENIDEDLEDTVNGPHASTGRDYYYEFGRSLGVEKQASVLKEHLDEESDFI
ncbi:hypothetical protein ACFX4N_24095 [Priestia sp. YIM B13551]|uniref:hypothetical protein n=1 Tax=Priestia sp. YIM B13551 TaxID=3366306 RepID=UPI003672F14E